MTRPVSLEEEEERPELALSPPHGRAQREGATCQPERGVSAGIKLSSTLTRGLPASSPVMNCCLLLSHAVCVTVLEKPQLRQREDFPCVLTISSLPRALCGPGAGLSAHVNVLSQVPQ